MAGRRGGALGLRAPRRGLDACDGAVLAQDLSGPDHRGGHPAARVGHPGPGDCGCLRHAAGASPRGAARVRRREAARQKRHRGQRVECGLGVRSICRRLAADAAAVAGAAHGHCAVDLLVGVRVLAHDAPWNAITAAAGLSA
ncbi:hypothetical protein G6F31_019534 [Rhizopus arrhizus]|nr:hypothetical protein G6F31_019534 [Rhizopus arrhizus]